MARRQDAFDDLVSIAAKLPWWISVLLALASYASLHLVAGMQFAPPKDMHGIGTNVAGQFIKVLALFGQYLVPLALLLGAGASALRRAKNRTTLPRRSGSFDDYLTRRSDERTGDTGADGSINRTNRRVEPTWESAPEEPKVSADRWSAELLAALEWKRFEDVCAGLFERLGFATGTFSHGPDGGVDIRLYQPPSNTPVAIVQCKAWSRKVGVNLVRELRGVMADQGVAEGIFVTTSGYTDDAAEFASANGIDLMDGKAVLNAIRKLPEEQQASLLRLATAGDYTTPTCASCGVKLVLRKPRFSGRPFWGCVNYPRCKMKINIASS